MSDAWISAFRMLQGQTEDNDELEKAPRELLRLIARDDPDVYSRLTGAFDELSDDGEPGVPPTILVDQVSQEVVATAQPAESEVAPPAPRSASRSRIKAAVKKLEQLVNHRGFIDGIWDEKLDKRFYDFLKEMGDVKGDKLDLSKMVRKRPQWRPDGAQMASHVFRPQGWVRNDSYDEDVFGMVEFIEDVISHGENIPDELRSTFERNPALQLCVDFG